MTYGDTAPRPGPRAEDRICFYCGPTTGDCEHTHTYPVPPPYTGPTPTHCADWGCCTAPLSAHPEHDWTEIPEGSALTKGVPFKFCTRCDREEWANGLIRPGTVKA